MRARSLPVLTNSAEKAWRSCARLYKLAYVDLIRPLVDGEALVFGTLIHAALEAWWKAAKTGMPADDWLRAALSALASERDPFRRATAEAMIVGYHSRWSAMRWEGSPYDGAPIEVLAVEQEFSGPLLNPDTSGASASFQRGGKIDALIRVAGDVWVVEHKCLPGSATVYDHSGGRYVTVKELHERAHAPTLTAMREDGSFIVAQAKPPVRAGVRPIFRVNTLSGRSLRASGNHPVWTHVGWVNASDLTTNHWVATPKRLESATPDAPFSDEAIRLIGYMIGDGSTTTAVSFAKRDENVLADVVACAAAVGENVSVQRPEGRAPYVRFSAAKEGRYRESHTLTGIAKPKVKGLMTEDEGYIGPVWSLLMEAGLAGKPSADKRAPLHLGLSDRQLGQLVGALWSTDGCVDSRGGTDLRIIYTSVSRGLCADIQAALQRLGVVTFARKTSVEYKGARRDVFTVQVVSRESKRRFLSLVHEGTIPVIRAALPTDDAKVCTSKHGADTRMQPRMDAHIWWDRVANVVEEPAEDVYDIEVPGPHTFVVDGIVTHNTSSEDFSAGSPYRARLRLDTQVSGYHVGARLLGHADVKGVLYDVLGKPSQKPLKATPPDKRKWTRATAKEPSRLYAGQRETDESPQEYQDRILESIAGGGHFARFEVVRLAHEEEAAARDTWQRMQEIRDAKRLNRYPRNPSSCGMYGRACAYLPVCSGDATVNDGTRYRKAETAHEELNGHKEAA